MTEQRPPKDDLNAQPKPVRKDFDAVLKKLLDSPPIPRDQIKTGKKKLNKVLGK